MSSASWGLMGGGLNLQNFVWDAKTGLRTKGNATGLDIRQIDNLVQMPLEQNVIYRWRLGFVVWTCDVWFSAFEPSIG